MRTSAIAAGNGGRSSQPVIVAGRSGRVIQMGRPVGEVQAGRPVGHIQADGK